MDDNTLILTIKVLITEAHTVEGHDKSVVMIHFSGSAYGDFFNGEVIGPGTDTQKYSKDSLGQKEQHLSARYMLSGTDYMGEKCKIFIENTMDNDSGWHPVIVTDSEVLSEWEHLSLSATVDGIDGGVLVRIYK